MLRRPMPATHDGLTVAFKYDDWNRFLGTRVKRMFVPAFIVWRPLNHDKSLTKFSIGVAGLPASGHGRKAAPRHRAERATGHVAAPDAGHPRWVDRRVQVRRLESVLGNAREADVRARFHRVAALEPRQIIDEILRRRSRPARQWPRPEGCTPAPCRTRYRACCGARCRPPTMG